LHSSTALLNALFKRSFSNAVINMVFASSAEPIMIASFYSQMDRYAYALVAVETSLVTAMLLAYLLPVQKH